MISFSDQFKFFKHLILLLNISHLLSCSRWVLLRSPVGQSIIDDEPDKIQIERYNGEKLILHNPVVTKDSLRGVIILTTNDILTSDQQQLLKSGSLRLPYSYSHSISLSDIKEVKVEEDHSALVAILIVIGLAGIAILFGMDLLGEIFSGIGESE